MATTKTLAPTNQTITIAAFQGEKPDQRQVADAEGKLADAVNALNSQIGYTEDGSFNSASSLATLLNNALSGGSNKRKLVRFSCTATFGCFITGVSYFIDLKVSSASYSSCIMQGVGYNSLIVGTLNNGTWSFKEQTADSGLQTIALSSSSQVRYRKIGNIVHVSVVYDPTVDGGVNSWSNKEIGVLPAGFRPCFNICVRAVPDRANASDFASITVDNGGKVMINSRNQAIDQSQGNVLYGWLVFAAFS